MCGLRPHAELKASQRLPICHIDTTVEHPEIPPRRFRTLRGCPSADRQPRPLGLPDPVNISLGVAALVTMIGSLLYGRLARQRWTDQQVLRFQDIKASIQEYEGNSTAVGL